MKALEIIKSCLGSHIIKWVAFTMSEEMYMCISELRLYVCISTMISQSSGAPRGGNNRIFLPHAQTKQKGN